MISNFETHLLPIRSYNRNPSPAHPLVQLLLQLLLQLPIIFMHSHVNTITLSFSSHNHDASPGGCNMRGQRICQPSMSPVRMHAHSMYVKHVHMIRPSCPESPHTTLLLPHHPMTSMTTLPLRYIIMICSKTRGLEPKCT